MVELKKEALELIDIIKNKGFEAYLVGGCVRDYLLNTIPSDYDITTNAKPDEILEIFKDYKTIPTGIKHGTISVIYKHNIFEVTTFRIESTYKDNRHPDKVKFINELKGDLARRDFTINALAYDGKVYDYFNGINDLHNHIIKCVGDANKRFNEDALRILRAIRFSFRFNFIIEEETNKEIHINKDLLKNISIERIIIELEQILSYNNYKFMKDYYDLAMVIFPFLKLDYKEDILNSIKDYETNDRFILTLAKIFSYLENDKMKIIIKKYHLKNDIVKKIDILNNFTRFSDNSYYTIKKSLKKNIINDIIMCIRYKYNKLEQEELITMLKKANTECHNLTMLNINGKDLQSLGIKKGVIIKDTLDNLLDLVIEDKLPNTKEILIDYVKTHNK